MQSFDLQTPHDLLKSFNAISSLRYSDDSIPDYLASFEKNWNGLRCRCDDADPPVVGAGNSLQTSLRILVYSDESKREFLITSLLQSMISFAVTLRFQAGGEQNYSGLYLRLFRYHEMERLKEQIAFDEVQSVHCTWCRSRGFESEGHEWKECALLREFKRRNR